LKEIHVSQKEGSKLGMGIEAEKGTAEKRRDAKQKSISREEPTCRYAKKERDHTLSCSSSSQYFSAAPHWPDPKVLVTWLSVKVDLFSQSLKMTTIPENRKGFQKTFPCR
jgi:hypothetical protein